MSNKTNAALKSFMEYSESKVLAFTSGIIKQMTGNVNFTTAAALVAKLVAAQAIYSDSLSTSLDGNRMQAAEKNAAKAILLSLLRELCNLVNFVAAGDRVLLLSSGFEVSKDISSPVVIEPAKNVIINYGVNSGEMDIAVKCGKGHKGLVFEYTVATDTNGVAADARWISQPSSTTQCTIVNMPVGERVYIRIGISGARRQLVYTAPVLKLVA